MILLQVFRGGLKRHGLHARLLRRIDNIADIDAQARSITQIAQGKNGYFLTVVFQDHFEARRAAIHGIQLLVERIFVKS